MIMETIKSLQYFEEVLKQHDQVVIIFSSDQCIDCLYLDGFIDEVITAYPSLNFFKIKRHELPEVFTHYNIYGVPSVFVYDNETIIGTYIDKKRKTKAQIESFLNETLKKGDSEPAF